MSLRALEQAEDALRSEVTRLEPALRKRYYEVESKKIRDPDTYAALNYLIIGGLHHFYLGRWLLGSLNLGLTLIGAITWIFFGLAGWVVIGLVLLIELPQLFRSQSIVKQFNNQVMLETLKAVQGSGLNS